jgi:hypothetical protein
MIKVILKPHEDDWDRFTGEGRTFGDAAADLLRKFCSEISGEPEDVTAILFGLSQLHDPERGAFKEYTEYDFSCPEDAFTLSVKSWSPPDSSEPRCNCDARARVGE